MKNKFGYIGLIIFLLSFKVNVFAQKYYFEGFIKSNDGNVLIGASIYDKRSKKGTITNEQGYFSLNLKRGNHEILISYVGYNPKTINLKLNHNKSETYILEHSTLNDVVIVASKNNMHLNPIQKPMEMDMATINTIPSIIGEPDIMKAITLFPGIAQTSEASSNLTVRGANHDQNLIILDEAPLYQTGHLFGFVSPFNYTAIKDVKVYKNAIPAIYGGKLSSVIELHSNNGNNDSLTYAYNYGLLNTGFSLSTPLKKDKVTFFLAGRTFYLGLLTLPVYYLYKKHHIDSYATYYLYDINTNIKFTPNENNEFSIYFYSGIDKLLGLIHPDKNIDKKIKSYLSWGNNTVSLKYKRRISRNKFFKNHITYSKSFNKTYDDYNDSKNQEDNYIKYRISSLNNITLKSYIEIFKGIHYIRYGMETAYNYIMPFEDKRTGFNNHFVSSKYNFIQADFFGDDLIELGKWSLYGGLRFSNYFKDNIHKWNIEPRLSINFKINESNSIGTGYQRLAQYSFLMPITNLGMPNDIWVSLLDNMEPSLIDQIFIEYNKDFYNKKFSLESSVFYRKYTQLYDIKNKTILFFAIPKNWQDNLSKNGKGYAYGLELIAKANFKKIKGIISYSYSRNKNRFSDLNNGDWFNGYYDLPHQLDINITGKLSKKWTFSTLFSFKSGRPVTVPQEVLEKSLFGPIVIFGEKNKGRLSPYHRLDLSVNKSWTTKKGRTKTLAFSLYNAYYHKNPFYYRYIRTKKVKDETTGTYKNIDVQPYIEEFGFLPIIPSFSYSIKF